MTDVPAAARGTTPTVVLIHGLWLSPRSWERWVDRYTQAGYRVLAPGWPGMDVEVEVLRKDPSVMDGLGVREVADHYEGIIRGLGAPPVLMGHSFGGLLVQILLDRGVGSAGVAIHPAAPKGVLRVPPSALKSAFPALRNPGNRKKTVGLTPRQWHYAFTNTMNDEDSQAAYDRYHVPTPGRPLFQAATANVNPHAATKVNFRKGTRAPLLLIGGGADHTVPVAVVRENLKRYRKSAALTEMKEYPDRPHFTGGSPGWEEVADHALSWSAQHQTTNPSQR
ncbi:MAG: alpha/beta hydrolase [Nocardioidaceae bacterium]